MKAKIREAYTTYSIDQSASNPGLKYFFCPYRGS